jgi:uncharacterized protein YkwD
MKKIILIFLIFVSSCSKTNDIIPPLHNYQYSLDELELLNEINIYRSSIGLNTLQENQQVSYICQTHNLYMIQTGTINHSYFQLRADNLEKTIGAIRVGENIAYNYTTPYSMLNAWLNSPPHKQNIEGNYTNFGVSITKGINQKNYTTLILVKIK